MAEKYLTEENLSNKTAAWLRDFARKQLPLRKEKSALLVVDMQEFFLNPKSHAHVPVAGIVLSKALKLVRCFLAHKRPVFVTRHVIKRGEEGMFGRWWKDTLYPEHPLIDLAPEIKRHAEKGDVVVVEKNRYSAFYNTPLEKMLRDRQVGDVVVTGVVTHLCCESTARDAFMRDFSVFIPVDGVGDWTENFHTSSLRNMGHGFATLTTTEKICREIKRQGAAAGNENRKYPC